ncbi:hypothetical protein M406DRAFT_355094 [Cryphonectria parasitica EP155]|uniref:Uncharacterized protein n=1 Tax=Cryphonectria parasitica (strain ATCC 38755 / EP155) TaxID=660469 RepID=A0A9P5CTA4_CRYP1|nr:uncharacterized protein M406DRAFT_355094 [Cryphonectria parasitica EP155]KAF3768950.1 hypothetical protein M406DRAFT_355094 [Cryphonectria parasitica EP155]
MLSILTMDSRDKAIKPQLLNFESPNGFVSAKQVSLMIWGDRTAKQATVMASRPFRDLCPFNKP